jgi:hypothetical protein
MPKRARRVWLLWTDHSVAGVFVSRAKASRARNELVARSLLLDVEMLGPYCLQEDA